MTDLATRLMQDRAMRNAARAVIDADLEHLKADFAPGELKSRLAESAGDVLDHAAEIVGDNRGVIGALLAAVAIWFARNPLLSLFEEASGADDEAQEPDGSPHRSEQDETI